jgi:hypothetical protein
MKKEGELIVYSARTMELLQPPPRSFFSLFNSKQYYETLQKQCDTVQTISNGCVSNNKLAVEREKTKQQTMYSLSKISSEDNKTTRYITVGGCSLAFAGVFLLAVGSYEFSNPDRKSVTPALEIGSGLLLIVASLIFLYKYINRNDKIPKMLKYIETATNNEVLPLRYSGFNRENRSPIIEEVNDSDNNYQVRF